ncbi:hypothetical protein ZWY2020_057222 [Hordeum vulgare]|nr:hypothetical protein ZWY2020_050988 [Hordeum vulgare]KAI4977310.1 hypothetical protein ZWY2020_057222 [Hordeum vulgare]
MDELTNRSRTFAEAVVTMVWLVLLALALNKPKWKSEVPGLDVPNFMLFLAGSTIITGICPLLACCVLEKLRAISDIAALFSAVMLFFLAYWIALFTVSDEVIVFWVALVFLASAAIVSGLTWRLLTHDQVRKMLENKKHTPVSQARIDKTAAVTSSANTASFCAHFFVAIATVLLMFEVCNVKMPMSAAAPAPARAARA